MPYTRNPSRKAAAQEAARLRLALLWTQAEMASALGVSPRTVRRLEAGEIEGHHPIFRLLRHVAQAAGAPGR